MNVLTILLSFLSSLPSHRPQGQLILQIKQHLGVMATLTGLGLLHGYGCECRGLQVVLQHHQHQLPDIWSALWTAVPGLCGWC